MLAWLSAGARVQRCGFSSISSLALETLGLRPRTTRSRLALHRVLAKHPELERAFLDGGISACQLPYIARLIEALPVPPQLIRSFIERVSAVPVDQLRHRARCEEERARKRAEAGRRGEIACTDDEGSMSAGALAALEKELWERDADQTPGPDSIFVDEPSDDPEMVPFALKHPLGFQVTFDEMMERTRRVLGHEAPIHECIEAMLAEVAWPGIGGDGPPPRRPALGPVIERRPPVTIPVRPEAIAHAKQTLALVAEYLEDVEQIDRTEEPGSPEEALLILRQIQLLRAPGKVLLAHLIRDLRRVGAVELLGYASVARMVEDLLKISERSARNRVAESLMFEGSAAMEHAFATGRISTMQAHLIRQLKHTEDIDAFIERARETTWRQFQREYRLLMLMRKCDLGRHALRPLSRGDVEEALVAALGGDREAIEESLRIRGIPPLPPGGSTDPAENPILMDRLETMVQLLALRQWEEVPETGEADRQTFAYQQAETWTRFPLPKQTYLDLKRVLWAYRREEPTGRHPDRIPRMPEWVAMAMLFSEVKEIWEQLDPERVPVRVKILERDRYRCVVPGCTRRDQLETHHVRPRSQGGSNDPGNLAVLCHGHHHHGVHKGHVKIGGTAPHALRYELGRRRDGAPLLVYRGNRLVRGPFDP
jgi:hypothetical protein